MHSLQQFVSIIETHKFQQITFEMTSTLTKNVNIFSAYFVVYYFKLTPRIHASVIRYRYKTCGKPQHTEDVLLKQNGTFEN